MFSVAKTLFTDNPCQKLAVGQSSCMGVSWRTVLLHLIDTAFAADHSTVIPEAVNSHKVFGCDTNDSQFCDTGDGRCGDYSMMVSLLSVVFMLQPVLMLSWTVSPLTRCDVWHY